MAICPNNTKIYEHLEDSDAYKIVVLHDTAIVQYFVDSDRVILNSGGWRSVTTKARMNQVADEWELDFKVYQKEHEWFVILPDGSNVPFTDYMEFNV